MKLASQLIFHLSVKEFAIVQNIGKKNNSYLPTKQMFALNMISKKSRDTAQN